MKLNTIKKWRIIPVLLIAGLSFASAQYSKEFYNSILKEYPNENLIQLTNTYDFNIDIVAGELEILLERKEQFILLKNTLGAPFDQSLFTSTFVELVDFNANSYIFNGTKYKKQAIKEYTEKTNFSHQIFYDDVKEYKFVFPGINNGSIVELEATYKIKDPRLLHTVFPNYGLPARKFDLKITSNKNIEMDILKFHMDNIAVPLTKKTERTDIVYALSIDKIDGILPQENEPNIRYYAPHLIPVIRSYKHNEKTIDVLRNTESLYKWYHTFLTDIYHNVDMEGITKISDSITKGCNSETGKVEKLFQWTQNNIKYIAFEYGLGGFIPRQPDAILKNRYGDCKDNTSMLHALLKSAGIESYFTWIGTRDIPYTYQEVSSPATDNHMILTYIDTGGHYHFLDATGKYNSFSHPGSFIQGKEALVGINDSTFHIKEVPILAAENNKYIDEVNLQINNNTIQGKGTLTLGGYEKVNLQYALNGNEKKEQSEYFENYLEKGSNKFVLNDFELPDLNSFDTTLRLMYDFSLDNYINKVSDNMYVNLNLHKKWLNYKPRSDRSRPISFGHLKYADNKYRLIVPDGYKVEYLPEDSFYQHEKFNFKTTYKIEDNSIVYHHTLKLNELIIDKQLLEEFKTFFNELEKAYRQTVLLSKTN